MQQCERCGEANPHDASFCGTCGLPLADPGGVAALAAHDHLDDEPGPTSEYVGAPRFGETAPPVMPPAAPVGDLPPSDPAAAGVATTAFPAGAAPPHAVTAVVPPASNGDPSRP